jgi:DNA-directed RNA polymerase subunit alpha
MTNFDKLTLEVTTDGSIDPEIALKTASQILTEHLVLIQDAFTEKKVETKEKVKKVAAKKAVKKTVIKDKKK